MDIINERHYTKRKKLFSDIKILDSDFVMVESELINVEAKNCPLIAFTILELAKLRNFTFFWKMKSKSPKTELIYCDTDSFILKCLPDWYSEMQPMKREFDFSNASTKFKQKLKISFEDQQVTRGVLGKYKSEICKNSVLVGVIALQKKTYCLLSITKVKCDVCKKWTAVCKCGTYSGKQLFKFAFNPHSKAKDLKQLNFLSYVDVLLGKPYATQTRYRFEQRNKQLKLSLKKYKSIVNFDDSNYLLSCKIHNIPFSKKNYANFFCKKKSCKEAFLILNSISQNFTQYKNTLFSIEQEKVQLWSEQ